MRLVTAVVTFPGPKLRERLTLKDVAGLNERFTEAELIIAYSVRETSPVGGVRGVRLNQDLCFYPSLTRVVFRINQVVYKDQLGICFCFIS